jgi:heat-inducible transcriptional repressor
MTDLTQRQIQILRCIVEEFIETAEPVGSESLERKYSLGISPATIRNEMSSLVNLGYLKKSHSSSGRAPTSLGLKYYVRNLIKPQSLSIKDEVSTKEKVWDYRTEFDRLLKELTRELATRTRSMAVATTDQGHLVVTGASNLLEQPEFYDIDVTKTVLSLLDRRDYWFELIQRSLGGAFEQDFHLLLGEDLGLELLEPCGFIYQHYEAGPYKGVMGVVGPARQHYSEIIPLVNYFSSLIKQITVT